MTRIIAICNQKGGVGKTTTATNLGAYLATMGKRVLLVDFDPQGNASAGLGHNLRSGGDTSIYEGLSGRKQIFDIIKESQISGFHFIPGHPNLAGATIELLQQENREYFLANFLKPVAYLYDYVLIDLPPSVSMLTINGLVAAEEILIPVQCEYYGLEGLGQILETVDMINHHLGRTLKLAGALLTMYDERESLAREVEGELRKHFVGHVYRVNIPRHSSLSEAPSFNMPICLYDPESVGALAYRELASEVIAQELVNFS